MKKLTEERIYEMGANLNRKLKIILVGKYTDKSDRNRWSIRYKCNKCGYEGDCLWDNFKRQGCPECKVKTLKEKNKKYTQEEIHEVLERNNLEIIEINNHIYKLKCKKCGFETKRNITHIMEESRSCLMCNGFVITNEMFRKEIKDLTLGEYEVVGNYVNRFTKVKIVHKECGHIYEVSPDGFVNDGGNRCPICTGNKYKGERKISEILKVKNVKFTREYTFDNLVGECNRRLRFDFAILNDDDSLKALIEYDGELHYIKTTLNNDLEKQKMRDELKNKYCKNNKIRLIRIPYWNFDSIEDILKCEGII